MNKIVVHGVKKLVKHGIEYANPWDTYEFMVGDVESPHEAAEEILEGSVYSNLTIVEV